MLEQWWTLVVDYLTEPQDLSSDRLHNRDRPLRTSGRIETMTVRTPAALRERAVGTAPQSWNA